MQTMRPKPGELPTNADCTIYNAHGSGAEKRFLKRVIKGVFWDAVKKSSAIKAGVEMDNAAIVFIGNKPTYLRPDLWQGLPRDETVNLFTLQKGDVLIFGTPEAPNEFETDVKVTSYFGADNAYKITSVDAPLLPDGTISHFEIGGA